jgi:hypothetical protein
VSSFEDGPAAGAFLTLRRAPVFLRVVIVADLLGDAEVDALDMPEDAPSDHEAVHVYEQVAGSIGHLCIRGPGGGCFQTARYRHRPDVDGEQLRDRQRWEAWASRQPVPALGGAA